MSIIYLARIRSEFLSVPFQTAWRPFRQLRPRAEEAAHNGPEIANPTFVRIELFFLPAVRIHISSAIPPPLANAESRDTRPSDVPLPVLCVCPPTLPQGLLTFCPLSPPLRKPPTGPKQPLEASAANTHHLLDSQAPASIGFSPHTPSILPPASTPFCFISNTCLLCSQLFPSRTTGGACPPGAWGLEKRLVTPREV